MAPSSLMLRPNATGLDIRMLRRTNLFPTTILSGQVVTKPKEELKTALFHSPTSKLKNT
jgi:hypothetical protein